MHPLLEQAMAAVLPAARTGSYLTLARRWPAQATITLDLFLSASLHPWLLAPN